MDLTITVADIQQAENLLAAGDIDRALSVLEQLRDDAELYMDAECETTDKKQFFSFESDFERLAYRRVEHDPRELVQVPVPFDRIYSGLAFAYIQKQQYEKARDMLMQAVRWNPMNCVYRLDLAELFRATGNVQEWASLSHSVLERASDASAVAHAYTNLGAFFLEEGKNPAAAAACARLATRMLPSDERVMRLLERVDEECPDAVAESDERLMSQLELEGVPTSPSAEIAVCLIMCATDAAAAGDTQEATRLTLKARDLIGAKACEALVKLVRESDAELARERSDKEGESDGE